MKNYKCFKEEVKLSLVASKYDKTTRADDNLFELPKFGLKILKSAIVYGANASGKTKLIEGLSFMKAFIFDSSKESQLDESINVVPFRLSTETEDEPSVFEIIFIHEEDMYRYGFEVNQETVIAEWLFHKPKTKEIPLFYRDEQDFEVNYRRFKVKDLVTNNRIRPNALLLSVAANWNDPLAKKILAWFQICNSISGVNHGQYEDFSANYFLKNKSKVIALLKNADLGIEDIDIELIDIKDIPEDIPLVLKELLRKKIESGGKLFSNIVASHRKYGVDKQFFMHEQFDMQEEESNGTRKLFALSGPILATLEKGSILVVDELANKLHPNLTKKIVEIFNSKEKNPNNAQLIFNTHDSHLLNTNLFRRDQIWFTDKDRYGAATIYSLASFKTDKVRKEDNFEKNYIEGRYGAIPYLNGFNNFKFLSEEV